MAKKVISFTVMIHAENVYYVAIYSSAVIYSA